MKNYAVYGVKIQNNPAKNPSYIQSIQAKNKKQACFVVANMIDVKPFYYISKFFSILDK